MLLITFGQALPETWLWGPYREDLLIHNRTFHLEMGCNGNQPKPVE